MPSKIGSIMMIIINSHRVLTSTILLSITYIFIATNVLGMYTGDVKIFQFAKSYNKTK